MTKKEFKAAMLCGLGRSVEAVKENPEKYRNYVLSACRKNISYDVQVEGTRTQYVYTMTKCYPDVETFVKTAIQSLEKYKSNSGWDLHHISGLLTLFADDGFESAQAALQEKYDKILCDMHKRRRRPDRVFNEMSDLEQIAESLAKDKNSYLSIARDFGKLYRQKNYLINGEFHYFFEYVGSRYRRALLNAAKTDSDIARFVKVEQAYCDEMQVNLNKSSSAPQNQYNGAMLSIWLSKNADEKMLEKYAREYRENAEPEQRAQALAAFVNCRYPDDPQPIIDDTQSDCEKLRQNAWWALEQIRHHKVRDFALINAANGMKTVENFSLLITNYTPKDAELSESLLREIIRSGDREDVHAAGMSVKRAFYENGKIPYPKHILPYLYENTPCSYCREQILLLMSKHRMLTKEILQECLFDSNSDIRKYAKKKLANLK